MSSILSNQGRTIAELPALKADAVASNDILIIQNIASNSTKKITISEFAKKMAVTIASGTNNLNFTGPNNAYSGSFRSYESDNYSVASVGIPNVLKRLHVTDYTILGGTVSFTGNTSFNSLNILNSLFANNPELYNGTIDGTVLGHNDPCVVTGSFNGNLKGNVNVGTGTSTFNNVNVDAHLYTNNPELYNGTIDGTNLGSTIPCIVTGSFKGNVQQAYTSVVVNSAVDVNLDFDTYDVIYLKTNVDGLTINLNLTQNKQCLLYFHNESGGTGYLFATQTANNVKFPLGGAQTIPTDGTRSLYSVTMIASDILVTSLGTNYL